MATRPAEINLIMINLVGFLIISDQDDFEACERSRFLNIEINVIARSNSFRNRCSYSRRFALCANQSYRPIACKQHFLTVHLLTRSHITSCLRIQRYAVIQGSQVSAASIYLKHRPDVFYAYFSTWIN